MNKSVALGSAVALYLLGLATAQAADLAAGKGKFATCIACHGPQGQGTPISPIPIAGRAAEEIAGLLERYRGGETIGPQSPLMFPHAGALSDQDISNVAAYINTL